VVLVLLTGIFEAGQWYCGVRGLVPSRRAELLWSVEFQLALVWWVLVDRKVRGFAVPFEFDAFMFFGWPVLLPYYLYRTRGRKGWLLVAGVYALWLIPTVAGVVARIERGR